MLDTCADLKDTDDYKPKAGEKVMKLTETIPMTLRIAHGQLVQYLFAACWQIVLQLCRCYNIESAIDREFTSDPKVVAHSIQLVAG